MRTVRCLQMLPTNYYGFCVLFLMQYAEYYPFGLQFELGCSIWEELVVVVGGYI